MLISSNTSSIAPAEITHWRNADARSLVTTARDRHDNLADLSVKPGDIRQVATRDNHCLAGVRPNEQLEWTEGTAEMGTSTVRATGATAAQLPANQVRIDALMTLNEVAELLRLPVATLYGWRHRGEGPEGYRIGKHVRYRRTTVEEWIEAQADRHIV